MFGRLPLKVSQLKGSELLVLGCTTVVGGGSAFAYHYSSAKEPSFLFKTTVEWMQEEWKKNASLLLNQTQTEGLTSTDTPMIDNHHMQDIQSQYYNERVKPTMEASVRALRLVQTVVCMIGDYQLYNLLSSNDDDFDIQKKAKELERLQKEYTNGPSDFDLKNNTDPATGQLHPSFRENWYNEKRNQVLEAANDLSKVEEISRQKEEKEDSTNESSQSKVHKKAAQRLLDLCRINGGVYVKVGQHLANLDYILPAEYVQTLAALFNQAPQTPYEQVRRVIKEELGQYPEELFDNFDPNCIASASLAQVHTATHKQTGEKLAIKVQHYGLRETSKGDLIALEQVVKLVDRIFDDFSWGWIVDEIAPNLPKELDFCHEAKNSEMAAAHLKKSNLDLDCIIPKVFWNFTTPRVLCMKFEDGFPSTDIQSIEEAGFQKREVANLISSVFNSQVFQSGHVHCDPHPANVLLRPNKNNKKKPQLVLVDHGLYKQIDNDFRIKYARLWKALMLADVHQIKESCEDLGVTQMYTLLAAMLTSRPFDEIMERSKSGAFSLSNSSSSAGADKAMIKGYAQQYLKEIIQMLDIVPRQMLLLFKMNDCLRHIHCALESPPNNSLFVAGSYASRAIYQHEVQQKQKQKQQPNQLALETSMVQNIIHRFYSWISFTRVSLHIRLYSFWSWWYQNHVS